MKKLIIIILLTIFLPFSVNAKNMITIRDDEIERYLQDISAPIFKSARLEAQNIKLFVVNDSSLNAFVAGGQNMFINTGLILEDNDPNMLIGVMAHEAGHIASGHLIRKSQNAKDAGMEAAIGYILGMAAAAISGSSEAAMAVIAGGQQLAEREFLKHSRSHEESADESAIKILNDINISPIGLLKLLRKLGAQATMEFGDQINPYRLTHPISSKRVANIAASLRNNPTTNYLTNSSLKLRHQRIIAKLRGFINKPKDIIDAAKAPSNFAQKYELAIAYYRDLQTDKAITLIHELIRKTPKDPYLYELEGQILFESGRVLESIAPYRKSVELLPNSALLQTSLASSFLASNKKELNREAISYLENARFIEPKNPHILQQLAIAYGREKLLGKSYLSLAEKAILFRKKDQAQQFIKRASEYIDISDNKPDSIKMGDLMKSVNLIP